MKRKNRFSILCLSLTMSLLATTALFTSCKDNDDTNRDIVVKDQSTLNQTVYADEEEGASGVQFTTLAPWTSSIREVPVTASATAVTRNSGNWLSINPESGNAGTHTIAITLEPNFTGNDRSAVIAIASGGTTIDIRITQQGVTEEGEVPEPAVFEIVAENIDLGDWDGEIATVKAIVWGEWDEGTFIVAEAPFLNNGFTLQLTNEIPSEFLRPSTQILAPDYEDGFIITNNLTISDKNAKTAGFSNIRGFSSDGSREELVSFFFGDEGEYEGTVQVWLYADRNVTIKGTQSIRWQEESGESVLTFDLNLRKGWNIIYEQWSVNDGGDKATLTSEKPAGANLRWSLDQWLYPVSPEPEVPIEMSPFAYADTNEIIRQIGFHAPWRASIVAAEPEFGDWIAIGDADWVSISPQSGEAGIYDITFTFEQNNTGETRYALFIREDEYGSFRQTAPIWQHHLTQEEFYNRPGQRAVRATKPTTNRPSVFRR
jgi:hypothetical protein